MERYPWPEYLLFEVLYFFFFYPTRQQAYRVVILATMVYVATQIYLTQEVTDTVWLQYSAGFMVETHLMFIAYILFAEGPFPNHWRRVRDEVSEESGAGGLEKTPSDFPLMKKLQWMVDIACGMRMIGWVQEPRNYMPPHPPPSRRTFLQKTLKLIVNIVIADLTTSYLALSLPFDYRIHNPTDGLETYLIAVPLLHRVPYVLAWAIGMGSSISTTHNAVALVCVGLGQSPTLWSDIWGNWMDAYTVRKLLGKRGTSSCEWYEHAPPFLPMCYSDDLVLIRCSRGWEGSGRLVANKFLGLPRGTNLSSYTQLYVAFFLSAILHFSGDFAFEKRIVSRSFRFFLLQAVGITFEDLVIYTTKRLLRRGGKADIPWIAVVVRVIGYCWVTLWLCWTLPVWLDEFNALGFSSADRRPIAQFLLNKWNRWA